MKGRGSPQQHGQRGRGYFGRGGRGSPASPVNKGTLPTIGAYLDLPPGRDIIPGAVTKWMNKIREYGIANTETRVCNIFGQDGTVGEYPVHIAPVEPTGAAVTPGERKIWELKMASHLKLNEKFQVDKAKLCGIMLGQMSDSSKIRARGNAIGDEAIMEDDPRKLLQAILATHIGDARLSVHHQLYNIRQKYNYLVMGPSDTLITFYQNIKSTLSGIEQAYTRAGKEDIDDHYPETEMAIKFTMGLNHHYDEYKGYYINSLREWPTSLEEAYMEAAKYNPYQKRAGQNQGGIERANAFAATGRGGGRGGRGRGRGRGGYPGGHNGKSTPNGHWVKDGPESPEGEKGKPSSPVAVYVASNSPPQGYKRGPCNNCGKYGHLAAECRGEPAQEYVQYWKEPGPRSPGGTNQSPQAGPGKGK